MGKTFKVGDHVRWNSEAGHVSGTIIKRHIKNVDYKGYTHHAPRTIRSMKSKATRPITSPCTRVARW
jgi:hypothetical protein